MILHHTITLNTRVRSVISSFVAGTFRRVAGKTPLAAISVLFAIYVHASHAAEVFCPTGSAPDPAVIWCDSFETDELGPGETVGEKYYEFDDDNGEFARTTADRAHGDYSLRARYQTGEIDAGHLILNFGRNPLGSQTQNQRDFREVYWRVYVKLAPGFVGHPDKYSRATIFANTNWAQAMIAHIWAEGNDSAYLALDPATGIDAQGNLVTTQWNDFPNLRWLGLRVGTTQMDAGRWYCLESRVRLNATGVGDGVFQFWIDGNLEAERTDLNWVGPWNQYGINALMLETYWNNTSPRDQDRYFDAFVVSTKRIGCLGSSIPSPPTNLQVR